LSELGRKERYPLSRAYGSCDIRGEYGKEVTEDDAYYLGGAVGYWLRQEGLAPSVLVGGDYRLSTEKLKNALIDGLVDSGCVVYDAGILPTPAYYFARKLYQLPAGVMVTASHNPWTDNGFKPIIGDLPLIGEEIERLWTYVAERKTAGGKGRIEKIEVMDAYKTKITSFFSPSKNVCVVIDSGNGCCGPYAPELFRNLGYDVIELFSEPDGRFPNRGPDTSIPQNLLHLGQKVRDCKASVGVGYDGDGDRFGAVDEVGRFIRSDALFVLFIQRFLKGNNGIVVYDIKLSDIVPQEARKVGCTPMMEKTGHAFIKHSFEKYHALLAGEYTGHFAFQEIGTDDGIFASLRLAQIVAESEVSLSQLIAQIPHYPITPDIRIRLDDETISEIINKVKVELSKEAEIITIDGVRVQYPDGWGLIRSSIYVPELSIRFEGYNQSSLQRIIHRFDEILPELDLIKKTGLGNAE